jgi:hypothetical protein
MRGEGSNLQSGDGERLSKRKLNLCGLVISNF